MLLAFFFFLDRTASATRRIGKLIAFQRRKKIVFLLSKNFKKSEIFFDQFKMNWLYTTNKIIGSINGQLFLFFLNLPI